MFIKNNPTIIYVTKNDAAILNNIDMEGGTVWITTKDQIPKPEWDCEKNCISDLRLRYCNLMIILKSVKFTTIFVIIFIYHLEWETFYLQ